jgi:translocation protein SEC72
MATTDDALDTYTHLPIQIDSASKQVSTNSTDKAVQDAIAMVNTLHTSFKSLETANVPPPPLPVNPKRSAQINKLRESAGQSAKKGHYQDAIRMLTVAIEMAATRPAWEPSGLVREELSLCYLARAAANTESNNWVEGWKDAECSTECKKGPQVGPQGQRIPGNPRAYILGARCLIEMSRFDDAIKWLERAIEVEGKDQPDCAQLVQMLQEARQKASVSG